MEETKTGLLSVVATPIGNMEDITLRALRILGEADYVLCEDTRVTGNLLKRHEVSAKLTRFDAHATERSTTRVLADLAAGKHIAMVTDAGTPGVSDPGVLLIAAARTAGCRIDAIPGASAVTAAVSIAGLTGNQFTFLGFAPQKKGRQTFFAQLLTFDHPVVFFESPHRIMKALQSLVDVADAKTEISRSIRVSVARELTKLHEEFVTGTPAEVFTYFDTQPVKQRGEFVVIVSPEKSRL